MSPTPNRLVNADTPCRFYVTANTDSASCPGYDSMKVYKKQKSAETILVDFFEKPDDLPSLKTYTVNMDMYGVRGIRLSTIIYDGLISAVTCANEDWHQIGLEATNMTNGKCALTTCADEKQFWSYVGLWQDIVNRNPKETSIFSKTIEKLKEEYLVEKRYMNLGTKKRHYTSWSNGKRICGFINHVSKYRNLEALMDLLKFLNYMPSTIDSGHKSKSWFKSYVMKYCRLAKLSEKCNVDEIEYEELSFENIIKIPK